MKKERSAFFQNHQSSYFNPNNMNMGVPMGMEANNSYYEGPMMGAIDNSYNNELETRILKIERQINRLDSRITKLESEKPIKDDYSANNMYML